MNPDNTEGLRKRHYDIDWDEYDDEHVPYEEEDYDMWDEEEEYEEVYDEF